MQAPLIESKLVPPVSQMPTVTRHHALEQLRTGTKCRAVLVLAPAGYGKTEVIAQWHLACRAAEMRVGWLSLDDDDGDIAVFVDYLTAALGRRTPHGSSAPATRRAALARVLEAVGQQARRTVMFIDDFDRVHGQLDDFVGSLIERAPPELQLVIASRTTPDFPLAALRTRGELLEFGPEELRMGYSEASEMLALQNSAAGSTRALSEGEVALLLERTEGWPIALQLAREFVASPGHGTQVLLGFSGRALELTQYLYKAVLRELPLRDQEALMRMACVPRISGDLLNALTDRHDGGELLATLAARNVPISRLDKEGQWYRLHPLLSEFLVAQLDKQNAGMRIQVLRKAAAWLAATPWFAEALRVAELAADPALLARLLDRVGGWRLGYDGRMGLLRLHAARLPPALLLRYPRLALGRALLLLKSPEQGAAGRWFRQIEQASSGFTDAGESAAGDYDGHQLGLDAQLVRIIITWYLDEVEPGGFGPQIAALRERDEVHGDALLDGALANMQAYELACQRRHEPALAACDEALRALQAAGLSYQQAFVRFVRVGIAIDRGRMADARWELESIAPSIEADFGADSDLAAVAGVLQARVRALCGDPDAAAALLERALPAMEEHDAWFEVIMAGYHAATAVHLLRGQGAAAMAAILRGQTLARQRGQGRLSQMLALLRIDLLISRGAVDEAIREAEAIDLKKLTLRQLGIDRHVSDAARLTRLRCALAGQGHGEHAADELAHIIGEALAQGACLVAVEAAALRVAALAHAGGTKSARVAAQEALAMAERVGVVTPLLLAGPVAAPILQGALGLRAIGVGEEQSAQAWRAAVDRALAGLTGDGGNAARSRPPGLSAREAEIALMLREGLSNKVIARRLTLSERTVKFHLGNLFAKLGVNSRAAVANLFGDKSAH